MDSIDNGATIRIGFYNLYYEDVGKYSEYQDCAYSMKIDKKTILKSGIGGRVENYMENFTEVAKKCAEIMKEKNVSNYVIYNGERIDWATNRWESCDSVPKDGENIFRKTLENALCCD